MKTITLDNIIYFIGALSTVITFLVLILNPFTRLKDNEKEISKLSETVKNQQKLLNSSIKVQMLLMEHIIYGNHVDNIKSELKNLQAIILETND